MNVASNKFLSLKKNKDTVNRAITIVSLLGVPIDGASGIYTVRGDVAYKYGNWLTYTRAAISFCLTEGLDIET